MAAAIPLVSAIFSVLAGLALLGLLARLVTFPTTAPTIATLLGLGVAVDYGLSWWPGTASSWTPGWASSPRSRRAAGTSGAAIVVAGSTVAVSMLGLYISGVGFVGALGLAAALVVVVTMISALTLVPAFMGLARESVRALTSRVRAHKEGLTAQQQARADRRGHARAARAQRVRPVGPDGQRPALAVGGGRASRCSSCWRSRCSRSRWASRTTGPIPTSDSNRQAYDLISQGFGVGVNGPLTVVVKLPNQSSSANSSLLSTMQSDIAKTAGVASVTPAQVNSAGTTAVFNVIPTTRPQATQTTALVEHPARHGAAQGARD